jgi:hypothetical protein
VLQALEEVKLREMAIIDLQKKIAEAETKFKQQQNLYEAVRVDRNMYSKKLIESQDEIQEMKRKFKIMNHQIEQLKDEISAKDMALVKEHFDHLRVSCCPLLLLLSKMYQYDLLSLPSMRSHIACASMKGHTRNALLWLGSYLYFIRIIQQQ